MASFSLIPFYDEDVIFDAFDLGFAIHSFKGGIERYSEMNKIAVDFLKAAVGPDRIDSAEDVT